MSCDSFSWKSEQMSQTFRRRQCLKGREGSDVEKEMLWLTHELLWDKPRTTTPDASMLLRLSLVFKQVFVLGQSVVSLPLGVCWFRSEYHAFLQRVPSRSKMMPLTSDRNFQVNQGNRLRGFLTVFFKTKNLRASQKVGFYSLQLQWNMMTSRFSW